MTLYVKNIHPKISEIKLAKIFGKFGKVSSVVMETSIAMGMLKAYGYVEMPNYHEAEIAISQLNGTVHKRSKIAVSPATILKNSKQHA